MCPLCPEPDGEFTATPGHPHKRRDLHGVWHALPGHRVHLARPGHPLELVPPLSGSDSAIVPEALCGFKFIAALLLNSFPCRGGPEQIEGFPGRMQLMEWSCTPGPQLHYLPTDSPSSQIGSG